MVLFAMAEPYLEQNTNDYNNDDLYDSHIIITPSWYG